jgi:hypothetical protein
VTRRRFHLAGLEVELRGAAGTFDDMLGDYHLYPGRGGEPNLIVDIERRPGFARDRERGPEYPAFRAIPAGAGDRYERFDASGEVQPGPPWRARFVVGESPNSLEAAIRIAVASALPEVGAAIFHASAIEAGGAAQLFLGVSGAGKSTIARLVVEAGAARPLSDELVVVSVAGDRPEVVVAPFIGARGLPHGERHALVALNLLAQASAHHRRELRRVEALSPLLRHMVCFGRRARLGGTALELAAALLAAVPCYELQFAPRSDVADAIGLTCCSSGRPVP